MTQSRLGLWLPEPQDSLIQTLCKVYGVSRTDPVLHEMVALHMALNPDIFAAHRPLTKRVIYLADIQINRSTQYSGLSKTLLESLQKDVAGLKGTKTNLEKVVPRAPAEVEAMRYVLGFNQVMGEVGTLTGIGVNTVSTMAGKHLFSDILEFNRWSREKADWLTTKAGKDIVHHYDSRMDDVTSRIKKRLGPTERFLFKGTAKDALFSGVPKALHPNPVTISAAERVKNVVSATKVAGAALLVVDAVLTCHKISATEEKKKVETAYEEIGGMLGSLLLGAGVGLMVASMATPVGWIGAIVISASTAYGGKYAGQSLVKDFYQSKGDILNLKDGRIINSWCK